MLDNLQTTLYISMHASNYNSALRVPVSYTIQDETNNNGYKVNLTQTLDIFFQANPSCNRSVNPT